MSNETPPNWPIHNVTLSEGQISKLVTIVFPESRLVRIRQLEKLKSFNNRLYFLSANSDTQQPGDQEVVLKVIGRFFDARKVQNEVAALLLLTKYCPEIPAPKVCAWSEDGSKVATVRNGVFALLSDSTIEDVPPPSIPHPWIMMSCCPGRVLTEDDVLGEHGESIAEQLSDMMKSWRQNIPPRQEIGNIELQVAGYTSGYDLSGLETIISDPILCVTKPERPLHSLKEYYRHLLADQIHKLETNEVFVHLRQRLLEKLRRFQEDTFGRLHCFDEEALLESKGANVFTHQDLSPRNILVSDSGSDLIITGILDFEFSGFFAAEEEFLTSLVRQESDWPKSFIDVFTERLKSKGVAVPSSKSNPALNVLFEVIQLIEDSAPWWLEAGHVKGQELRAQLDEVCIRAEGRIDKLAEVAASSSV